MKQLILAILFSLGSFSFAFAGDHCVWKKIAPWLECDAFESGDWTGSKGADKEAEEGDDSDSGSGNDGSDDKGDND